MDEITRLHAFVLTLANRLYLAAECLAHRAERKDKPMNYYEDIQGPLHAVIQKTKQAGAVLRHAGNNEGAEAMDRVTADLCRTFCDTMAIEQQMRNFQQGKATS